MNTTTLYPDAETAAHTLAEEIKMCNGFADKGVEKTYWMARRDGLLQAAWVLGIESSVFELLGGGGEE